MRYLAVYESDTKRLQALDPAKATGVPIPAFRSGLALPRAGTIAGEAFINTNDHSGYVWDGNQWNAIAKPVISIYPTEGALLGDNPSDDTVALASDTGNMFIRTSGLWRSVTTRIYNTEQQRDASPDHVGTLAFTLDTGRMAIRVPSGNIRPDAAPTVGAVASEAELQMGTAAIMAAARQGMWFALDPGYDYPGVVGGGTVQELPDPMSGANGDWAIWDGMRFIQVDGSVSAAGSVISTGNPVWAALDQQLVTVGGTAPANPVVGQQWFDNASNTLFTWDGALWKPPTSGVPLGTIITHASVNPPAGYLLCDGSAIPAGNQFDPLRAMIGANVPDLTDQFIRGTDSQAEIDGFNKHPWSTAKPHNDFHVHASGTTSSGGSHSHTKRFNSANTDGNWDYADNVFLLDDSRNPQGYHSNIRTSTAGSHIHNVSVDGTVHGGGDSETAGPHVRLAHHIKAIA